MADIVSTHELQKNPIAIAGSNHHIDRSLPPQAGKAQEPQQQVNQQQGLTGAPHLSGLFQMSLGVPCQT